MGLPHGWSGLRRFWAMVVGFCGAGAFVLQVLGPPPRQLPPDPPVVEFASRPPATELPPEAAQVAVEETTEPAAPITAASPETIELPVQLAASPPEPTAPAVVLPTNAAADPPANGEKTLQVRVARDSKRCPKTICYKWHLVSQHLKPPRPRSVDLQKLNLARDVRDALHAGKAELIVEAVSRHTRIKGRDAVVLVAIKLTDVEPPGADRCRFAAAVGSGA